MFDISTIRVQNDYQEVQIIHLRSILLTKNLFDAEALALVTMNTQLVWRLCHWARSRIANHCGFDSLLFSCLFMVFIIFGLGISHLYYVRCHTGQVIPKLFTPVMAHTRNIRLLRRFCVCLLMLGFVLFWLLIKLIIICDKEELCFLIIVFSIFN